MGKIDVTRFIKTLRQILVKVKLHYEFLRFVRFYATPISNEVSFCMMTTWCTSLRFLRKSLRGID